MMRKTSVVLLSAATGAALTLLVTQPRAVFFGSSARAATADTYRQLNLFGDVFDKIREFGGSDGAGGVEKGISLAVRPGAQVTTPCDGWVVYAGPFRSYGQLLILNAGGGYHVLIAGMERISVNIGQFVLTGEPVATMGSTSQVASILATNASQPVLYVEFRKDGTPIDPGPWWAANEGEKVRG